MNEALDDATHSSLVRAVDAGLHRASVRRARRRERGPFSHRSHAQPLVNLRSPSRTWNATPGRARVDSRGIRQIKHGITGIAQQDPLIM